MTDVVSEKRYDIGDVVIGPISLQHVDRDIDYGIFLRIDNARARRISRQLSIRLHTEFDTRHDVDKIYEWPWSFDGESQHLQVRLAPDAEMLDKRGDPIEWDNVQPHSKVQVRLAYASWTHAVYNFGVGQKWTCGMCHVFVDQVRVF